MYKTLATVIFALTTMFAVNATADQFEDGTKVLIEGMPGGGTPIYFLEQTGVDEKHNAGIYRLRTQYDNYLDVRDANAGTMVGWTNTGEGKGSEWILFKNSSGWSIIAKGNGANTVSINDKTSSGLDLQRNQGAKHQVWNIVKQ